MSDYREYGYRASSRGKSRSRQEKPDNSWLIIGGIVVIILTVLIIVVNIKNSKSSKRTEETSGASAEMSSPEEETFDDSGIRNVCDIDLGQIPGLEGKVVHIEKGMNRTEILKEIQKAYSWDVQAVNQEAEEGTVVKPTVDANETTAVGSGDEETSGEMETEDIAALKEIVVQKNIAMDDLIMKNAIALLDTIFEDAEDAGSSQKISIYQLKFDGLDEAVEEFAQDATDMWYVEPRGGSIGSYDLESNQFLMEGSSDGARINKEKLIEDLKKQLERGNFECKVPVTVESLSAEGIVENGEYTVIAEYVTQTTGNPVRNTNIRLACEKLNGTIVRPGEEFSYNYTIGERTAEKGYGSAAAYSNGEVVQEIGGGVCQVSSTLYNAITQAGLKTTYRSPHTFKPTYITPGQDATVSWNGPDYRFANVIALPDISFDNTYAIGILAHYEDQTVTVSIYGRPVLKPGYSVKMESELTGEVEMVRETIPEGSEKQPSAGDKGSTWKTYLHITKDGNEVSREICHTTRYKGHTEYYYETLPESSSEETSDSSSFPEEYGPGYINMTQSSGSSENPVENTFPGNNGPGLETQAQSQSQSNTPGAVVIDEPGGLPGLEPQSSEANDGPQIIEDGP